MEGFYEGPMNLRESERIEEEEEEVFLKSIVRPFH
jgi:hypothetical protein